MFNRFSIPRIVAQDAKEIVNLGDMSAEDMLKMEMEKQQEH